MSDIEKLARLAEQADELLDLRAQVHTLKSEIDALKARELRVLTTKEAAKLLDVTSATVVSWVNRGMIPALMSRNGYKIPAHKIFEIAERQAMERAKQNYVVTRSV